MRYLFWDLARRASPWSPLTWAAIIGMIAVLMLLTVPGTVG